MLNVEFLFQQEQEQPSFSHNDNLQQQQGQQLQHQTAAGSAIPSAPRPQAEPRPPAQERPTTRPNTTNLNTFEGLSQIKALLADTAVETGISTKEQFATFTQPDLSKDLKSSLKVPTYVGPFVNVKIEEVQNKCRDLQNQTPILAKDDEAFERPEIPKLLKGKTKLQFKKNSNPQYKTKYEQDLKKHKLELFQFKVQAIADYIQQQTPKITVQASIESALQELYDKVAVASKKTLYDTVYLTALRHFSIRVMFKKRKAAELQILREFAEQKRKKNRQGADC